MGDVEEHSACLVDNEFFGIRVVSVSVLHEQSVEHN